MINILLILIIILTVSCYNKEDDCYYPFFYDLGAKVVGAGSDQYNGDYISSGGKYRGYPSYNKLNTPYTIEFDRTLTEWCIKDNGIIQYYKPCITDYPYECVTVPYVILNGQPPVPTIEKITIILPTKCGM